VLDGYDYSVVGLVGRAVLELVILSVFGERKLAWFLVRDICKFERVGQCKRSVMGGVCEAADSHAGYNKDCFELHRQSCSMSDVTCLMLLVFCN
jgi:hypothetical protein